MAKNPDVQQKLQAEIDKHFTDDVETNYDNVSELQYLDMVLNESMRVYPPIAQIGRYVERDKR